MAHNGDLKLAVLGLGHVGLPTALGLADLGWPVVGTDDDAARAEKISRGEAPFYEPGLQALLRQQLDSGRFTVEPDGAAAIREATVLFVCVGTPEGPDGAADMSYMDGVARALAANLNGYKLLVEKSTTPVRTAERIKQSILRYSDFGPEGVDFDVAVNPEFLREGRALQDFSRPDRIVLGVETERSKELLMRVYRPLLDRMGATMESSVVVTDINTAEVIKHASNAFLATKLSFVNMVSDLCEASGANVEQVARGIGMDPRIGLEYLRAGIGFGGSCLPKDIRAFIRIAEEHGVDFSLLKEVQGINERRVDTFLALVRKALWVIGGKVVAIWGLSFKPGTDDIREAPSRAVVGRLREEGALLRLYDPQALETFRAEFPEAPPSIHYALSPEDAADGADAVLVLTEWKEFLEVDLGGLREQMNLPIIVDGRNLLDPTAARAAGFEYYSIGRP